MAGKSIARTDVSSLSVPTVVSVPKSVDDATTLLDGVGGLLSAGQWGTAAVVWAFTEDQQGSNQHRVKVRDALGIREFAALGIRGLKSDKSVAKYRSAWQHAIDEGWAKPATPGKRCVLPEQPFEFLKTIRENGTERPFDEDAAAIRLRDWLRLELAKWPDKHKHNAAHWVRQVLEKEFNL